MLWRLFDPGEAVTSPSRRRRRSVTSSSPQRRSQGATHHLDDVTAASRQRRSTADEDGGGDWSEIQQVDELLMALVTSDVTYDIHPEITVNNNPVLD